MSFANCNDFLLALLITRRFSMTLIKSYSLHYMNQLWWENMLKKYHIKKPKLLVLQKITGKIIKLTQLLEMCRFFTFLNGCVNNKNVKVIIIM